VRESIGKRETLTFATLFASILWYPVGNGKPFARTRRGVSDLQGTISSSLRVKVRVNMRNKLELE
jgi:hypothetical protein